MRLVEEDAPQSRVTVAIRRATAGRLDRNAPGTPDTQQSTTGVRAKRCGRRYVGTPTPARNAGVCRRLGDETRLACKLIDLTRSVASRSGMPSRVTT